MARLSLDLRETTRTRLVLCIETDKVRKPILNLKLEARNGTQLPPVWPNRSDGSEAESPMSPRKATAVSGMFRMLCNDKVTAESSCMFGSLLSLAVGGITKSVHPFSDLQVSHALASESARILPKLSFCWIASGLKPATASSAVGRRGCVKRWQSGAHISSDEDRPKLASK